MDAAIQAKIDTWLNGNFDAATKDEIKKLQKENPSELADAFYRNLEFGTGGLRGLMGVGTNRMNKYTVGMATQGYANYLKQCFPRGLVWLLHMIVVTTVVFLLKLQRMYLQRMASKFICLKHCGLPRNYLMLSAH